MIVEQNNYLSELSHDELVNNSGGSVELAGLVLAIAVFCYELGKDCKEHDSK